MSFGDIPLKVINFASFWLNNEIKDKKLLMEELGQFANDNKYSINQEKLLQILDTMVASGLALFDSTPNGKMAFYLIVPKVEELLNNYKRENPLGY